jgi:GNAT superfamily N-acetyltransferase
VGRPARAQDEASIEVVSNAQVRENAPLRWDDPDGLGELSPEKRSALLANPFLGGDEPARLLAVAGSRIAGRIDLVAGELETPSGRVGCFWGSALRVSPDFRGRGLAEALLRESERFRPVAGVCAPSRMSLPLYRRLGYVDLPLRRYVLVRSFRPLAQRWLGRGGRAATAAVDLGARAHRRLLATRRPRATAERVAAFPPELAPRLVERRRPFATHRPAAWVDWVLRESFYGDEQERASYVVRGDHGEPAGCFLVKTRRYSGVTRWRLDDLRLASLVDWTIFEPAALRLEDVALLALETVDEVDAFEVCVPPGERTRLGRLGFVPAGEQHVLLRRSDGGELADDPTLWTLRPGDGDHVFS